MQPPRDPPAAVDARSAGSARRLALFGSVRRATRRQRPLHNLRWQCTPPRPPLAASLPHYGTRETRSRLRQSTSRMNGLFAGGFWTRHALPGEIRTPRTFSGRNWTLRSLRVSKCRPTTSLLSKCRPKRRQRQDIEPANTHSVRISPENAIPVRMPREGLRSRPYTRPNASNAVATPSSHTGSVT